MVGPCAPSWPKKRNQALSRRAPIRAPSTTSSEHVFKKNKAPLLSAKNLQLSRGRQHPRAGCRRRRIRRGDTSGSPTMSRTKGQTEGPGGQPASRLPGQTVDNGTYPLSRPLFLYSDARIIAEKAAGRGLPDLLPHLRERRDRQGRILSGARRMPCAPPRAPWPAAMKRQVLIDDAGRAQGRPAPDLAPASLERRARPGEAAIKAFLLACAAFSVFTTAGIVFILGKESLNFFSQVSPRRLPHRRRLAAGDRAFSASCRWPRPLSSRASSPWRWRCRSA